MDEQALIEAAQRHEQYELEKAMLAYLKERVVVLQVELAKTQLPATNQVVTETNEEQEGVGNGPH